MGFKFLTPLVLRKSGAIVEGALANLQSYVKILVDKPAKEDDKREMNFEKFIDVGSNLASYHIYTYIYLYISRISYFPLILCLILYWI